MGDAWSNWSGSVRCAPHAVETPETESALAAGVLRAASEDRVVRPVGTGHSFAPLVATDGIVVSLDRLCGIESHDRAALEATVRAGTRLSDLGDALLALGMAMENLGDVDVQSLGGALGTGTHGTGATLRNLSSQAVALRLVTASGDILECSADRHPEAWLAARVSLGALGIIAAVRLRLRPAYRLHERIERMPVEDCLPDLDERVRHNRHFEFFYYPQEDVAELKTLNPTDAQPDDLPDSPGERIGWSAKILPSVREHRFNEMEYAVPAAAGPDCFREVRERLRSAHPDVAWPVEYRTLRADDAYLSPAHARESVTISIHQDARLPHRAFFRDVEKIFVNHRGRPHWGKVHTRTAQELRELYPAWDRFQAVRRELDPDGRFQNEYLRQVLGS
jgi:FAD/FMN-containing dehydrogenase